MVRVRQHDGGRDLRVQSRSRVLTSSRVRMSCWRWRSFRCVWLAVYGSGGAGLMEQMQVIAHVFEAHILMNVQAASKATAGVGSGVNSSVRAGKKV